MDNSNKKSTLKICLIGDSGVGKTSLLKRYVKKKFQNEYKVTVGADLESKEIEIDDKKYNLQIWDTAGQEKYQSIGSAFYRGSDCCFLVYDITNKKSLENLENWRNEFINQGSIKDPEDFPFIILGNKFDKKEEVENIESIIKEYSDKLNLKYYLVSAKEDININEAIMEGVKLSIKRMKDGEIFIPPSITHFTKPPSNKNKCC